MANTICGSKIIKKAEMSIPIFHESTYIKVKLILPFFILFICGQVLGCAQNIFFVDFPCKSFNIIFSIFIFIDGIDNIEGNYNYTNGNDSSCSLCDNNGTRYINQQQNIYILSLLYKIQNKINLCPKTMGIRILFTIIKTINSTN